MLVDKIRTLCKEHGTSVWALERELGIGNGIIARWSTSSPTAKNLKRVADYFHVSVDELLRDTSQDGM